MGGSAKKPQFEMMSFRDRKSRGIQRVSFNEHITKIPGIYNEKAKVVVDFQKVEKYDFFNLTSTMRANYLNENFKMMERELKRQLKMDETDEFTSYSDPIPECVRIVGRVVNLSKDEEKISE